MAAGRMLIGQGAIDACKIGVTIATRYACARPQFGTQFIMGYLTHQRRLLPALACAYGLHLTMLRLKVQSAPCSRGMCRAAYHAPTACIHPLPTAHVHGL